MPKFNLLTVLALQLPLPLYHYVVPVVVPPNWYKATSSFVIAVHFAFGLAISGMLQPSKIKNSLALPLSLNFDPSLAFVAIGGVLPNLLAWIAYGQYLDKPLYSSSFELTTNNAIDWKLILGSVTFGIGWGLSGICPGPGLVVAGASLEQWRSSAAAWVSGMTIGRLLTMS